MVDANRAFALDLYDEISADGGNVFYSPYSISLALSMTYAGARGDTATEMADTMHFGLDQDQLHPAFNWLDLALTDLGEPPEHEDSEPFELSVANSIWGQRDYHFEDPFLNTLAVNYGAGLRTLDFAAEPEPSRKTINAWVADQTRDRIQDLIAEGLLGRNTKLVLTNAIYFKASWYHAFDDAETTAGQFTLADESTVNADLMHQTAAFSYADLDGYKALEMPYDGGDVSMLVMLPDDLDASEQDFDPSVIDDTVAHLSDETVELTFPKFEFERPIRLSDTLKAMGMPQAFTSDADFSGMTGNQDLFIDKVLHKAFIAVDESGTEAAAATATAVINTDTSVPTSPKVFEATKPFVFVIRDNTTGSLLFVGRISDPTA